jgi:uncharacterized membrane protein
MRTTLLTVHITAGGLAIVSGFVALYAAKGARLHRSSGTLFVWAMLAMSLIGATSAAIWNRGAQVNIPVGLLTAYLVITALTAVRPVAGSRRLDVGLMLVAIGAGLFLVALAVQTLANPTAKLGRMPVVPFFIFASIALMAGVGDLRLIRSGGVHTVRGTPRLVRHLWRMSCALLIAAFSFFIGQAKVIPKPIRIVPLLLIPPLVVLSVMLYWLWRVRSKRSARSVEVGVSVPGGIAQHV